MTALHEVPGLPPAQERRISRRRILFIGLGAGAAAAGVTGGFLFGGSDEKSPARPGTAGQGGQGAAETTTTTRPDSEKRAINPGNIYHIQQVLQGTPELEKKVVAFMGGGFQYIVGRPPDGAHPWLQLTTPKSEHLTFSLRPVGLIAGSDEPVRSWAEAEKHPAFNPDKWEDADFAEDTKVSFNDAHGYLAMAGVTGWTNIGTSEERRFSLQSNRVSRLETLSADQRRAEFMALTGALFDAHAFG